MTPHLCAEIIEIDPPCGHHFFGIQGHFQVVGGHRQKDVDYLVFDQAAADISAVFDTVTV